MGSINEHNYPGPDPYGHVLRAFHQFIVDADDQPGRHPLGDKVAPLALTGRLTDKRQRHRTNRDSQVGR